MSTLDSLIAEHIRLNIYYDGVKQAGINQGRYITPYEFCRETKGVYSADDVEGFGNWLSDITLNPHLTGHFISHVINHSPDKNFTLTLNKLTSPIQFVGFENRKNVTLYKRDELFSEPVFDFLGSRMIDGSIEVHASASRIGYELIGGNISIYGPIKETIGERMSGGNIRINNDVYSSVGSSMSGGSIEINGNVFGMIIGIGMTGGEIRINGNNRFKVSKKIKGGTIYHKNVPIVVHGQFTQKGYSG